MKVKVRIKHSGRPGAQRSTIQFVARSLDLDEGTVNTRHCPIPFEYNRGEVVVTLTSGPADDLVCDIMRSSDYSFCVERFVK